MTRFFSQIAIVLACTLSPVLAADAGKHVDRPSSEHPVIAGEAHVKAGPIEHGELLLAELNCVACHTADDGTLARLSPKAAPLLGELGARVTPQGLRAYLTNPHAAKPGTTMPNLFHASEAGARDSAVDYLMHFLLSQGKPLEKSETAVDAAMIGKGRELYHTVGCVACHAPQEPPSAFNAAASAPDPFDGKEARNPEDVKNASIPLGKLASKVTVESLAAFLLDPLKTRPAGRMPSTALSKDEATAIAAYLLREQMGAGAGGGDEKAARAMQPLDAEAFKIDPQKAAFGSRMFSLLRCASCHQLEAGKPLPAMSRSKPLAAISVDSPDGCLSDAIKKGYPKYNLSESQNQAIRAALAARESLAKPLEDKDRIARTMLALNCYACHARDSMGGPEAGRAAYFRSLSKADLGDEGRLPPGLSQVGAKLKPEAIRDLLSTHEGRVRPYIGTRMPSFGEASAGHLAALFDKADSPPRAASEPDLNEANAEVGRKLVGTNGFACVKCHDVAGAASLGTPGIDLSKTYSRVKYDWYARFMTDPLAINKHTRMPTFWPQGKSPFADVLGGDMKLQQDAIWHYLSLGGKMSVPEGLQGKDGTK